MKSKVEMELKTTSTLKKKDKLVKNLKAKFGEGLVKKKKKIMKRMKRKNKNKLKNLLH